MSAETHMQSLMAGWVMIGNGCSNLYCSCEIGDPGHDTPGLIRSSRWRELKGAAPDKDVLRSNQASTDVSEESERLLPGRGTPPCVIRKEGVSRPFGNSHVESSCWLFGSAYSFGDVPLENLGVRRSEGSTGESSA